MLDAADQAKVQLGMSYCYIKPRLTLWQFKFINLFKRISIKINHLSRINILNLQEKQFVRHWHCIARGIAIKNIAVSQSPSVNTCHYF